MVYSMASSPGSDSMEQENPLLGHVIEARNGKFRIEAQIGRGGGSEVYRCVHVRSGKSYAAKVEHVRPGRKSRVMSIERPIMAAIQKRHLDSGVIGCAIPSMVAVGTDLGRPYLIMDLTGPSLSVIRRTLPKERFSLMTTLRAGVGMVSALHEVHRSGFVHCDVKPGNFTVDVDNPRQLRIIDLGVAQRYMSSHWKPLTPRKRVQFKGTVRYASVYVHNHQEPSPRDDYWALLHSLIEMLQGKLPWSQCCTIQTMVDKKTRMTADGSLTAGMPACFGHIAAYLKTLDYYDKVDSEKVAGMLKRQMRAHGIPEMGMMDWERRTARGTLIPLVKLLTACWSGDYG